MPFTKNYYQRPTPATVLFEEQVQSVLSYNGKSIYEWNLDGFTEYQIIILLHNMLMYATICRTNNTIQNSTFVRLYKLYTFVQLIGLYEE